MPRGPRIAPFGRPVGAIFAGRHPVPLMTTRITLTYQLARRIVVGLVGVTVLLVGVAMLVLPGPGIVVIPLGLGILGLEFAWARRWLSTLKKKVGSTLGNGPAPQSCEPPGYGDRDRPKH